MVYANFSSIVFRISFLMKIVTLWVWIPSWRDVLDTTLCDKVCQWLAAGRWFSPSTPVSPTNKTDHYNLTEISLKVVLSTITLTLKPTWLLSAPPSRAWYRIGVLSPWGGCQKTWLMLSTITLTLKPTWLLSAPPPSRAWYQIGVLSPWGGWQKTWLTLSTITLTLE